MEREVFVWEIGATIVPSVGALLTLQCSSKLAEIASPELDAKLIQ